MWSLFDDPPARPPYTSHPSTRHLHYNDLLDDFSVVHLAPPPAPAGYESCLCQNSAKYIEEMVRSRSLAVEQVNRTLRKGAAYSQIHPKPRPNGKYPEGFSLPMTVLEFQ